MRTPAPHRRAAVGALLTLLAFALFFRLGDDRVWRASEIRCLAVVQGMVENGNWLVPRIGSEPRLLKPPLFYWAGVVSSLAAGGVSPLALRRVSALAALALAAAVCGFGAALRGTASGVAAGAALGASALFLVRARTGDAEMLLALLCFLALVTFERLWRTRDRRLLPLLAGLVALAFMTKATAALLTVFVPIAVWLALHGQLRLALRPPVLRWAAASAALSVAWYAFIAWRVPGAPRELLAIATLPLGTSGGIHAGAEHYRSVLHYLPRLPLQTLPASLLAPWMIAEAVRTRFFRGDERLRFVATSWLAIFTAWSLVPQKQMHYLLPLVPLQAVLAGAWLAPRLARLSERLALRAESRRERRVVRAGAGHVPLRARRARH